MIQGITPDDVRRATEVVLREPEFQESIDAWSLALNALKRFLQTLAEWAFENPDAARFLMIVLSVILGLLVAHIAYTVIREFAAVRNRLAGEGSNSRPLQALEGIASNWADAFQLAKKALDAGDIYRALWITHRVLLSALDRMDLLRFARWKTNRDYLRECRANHAASKTLEEVSEAYERVVYAHGQINKEDAAGLLNRVEALVLEAKR